MTEQPLVNKLYLKDGYRVVLLNEPQGYREILGTLPSGVKIETQPVGLYDFVQVFVSSKTDIERYAVSATAALRREGTLWFCYPKKSGIIKTDITRDIGWEALVALGWGGVRQVSIDDTWSAIQFKLEASVKRKNSRKQAQPA